MTDQANVPIPRPPCTNCGHKVYHHDQQGKKCFIWNCKCTEYESKSYGIEPGPTNPTLPAQVDQPQQLPRPGVGDIQSLVIEDLRKRREFGVAKYGTPLQAFNGRDALMDAYQEALDLAVYLRQAILEKDLTEDASRDLPGESQGTNEGSFG